MGENTLVPYFRHHAFPGDHIGLQEAMETHHAEADRALALSRIFRFRHFIGRALDEIFQHIIQKAHDIGNEGFVLAPLIEFFCIRGYRQHTAVRSWPK